ncbi:MAG: 50S ribosomal protein L11 methyltransferase, partial [Defluviitaleaceae bacterium]|nr:50S ribosomal protein L11 methyltransferase [Defluviitaleaceae bacterium]
MEWNKVVITTKSELVDIVLARLLDFGIESVEIMDDYENLVFLQNNPKYWDYIDESLTDKERGDGIIRFFIPLAATDTIPKIAQGLDETFPSKTETVWRIVDDTGWLNEWKKYYKPFKIGQKIVIVPVWEEYEAMPGEIIFKINPGHVFGTGLHQSTKL